MFWLLTCSGTELFFLFLVLVITLGLIVFKIIKKKELISWRKIGVIFIVGFVLSMIGGVIFYTPEHHTVVKVTQQFKWKVDRDCNTLCSSYVSGRDPLAGIEYCKTVFTFDFNEDRDRKDPFQTDSLIYACEDSFYCPLMHRCELEDGEVLTLDKCKELLCDVLVEKHTSAGEPDPKLRAEEDILGLIQRGSCTLPEGEPDWYDNIYGTTPVCP